MISTEGALNAWPPPCAASRGIGAYDTCLAGCRYCYATSSFERSRANYQRHDPQSPQQMGWPAQDPEG